MTRSLDVYIDDSGQLHPIPEGAPLPHGRARLLWEAPETTETLVTASEVTLAEDWLRPEEDDAWSHLQLAK